jgi:hypothetical protein
LIALSFSLGGFVHEVSKLRQMESGRAPAMLSLWDNAAAFQRRSAAGGAWLAGKVAQCGA